MHKSAHENAHVTFRASTERQGHHPSLARQSFGHFESDRSPRPPMHLSQVQASVEPRTIWPIWFQVAWHAFYHARCVQPLLQLLVICLYIFIGTVFYSNEEGWSYIDGMYFTMVTMSTVGYGDFSPTAGRARVFTIFYALVGIIVVFTQVGALVNRATRPCFEALRVRLERAFPTEGYDLDGDGNANYRVPPHLLVFAASRLLGPFLLVTIVQLVAAALFVRVEGWEYGTAFYHCCITATTIGYGDISIATELGVSAGPASSTSAAHRRPAPALPAERCRRPCCTSIHRLSSATPPLVAPQRALAFCHIVCSVSVLASLIGEIDVMRDERRAQRLRQRMVLAKLDDQMWQKIVPDDETEIDKFDFVYRVLVQLEVRGPCVCVCVCVFRVPSGKQRGVFVPSLASLRPLSSALAPYHRLGTLAPPLSLSLRSSSARRTLTSSRRCSSGTHRATPAS